MRVSESCASCLYDKQAHRVDDAEYLRRVREIIDSRRDADTSPYLVYLFKRVHEEMFGRASSYSEVKKKTFPRLEITVLVRGGEALDDATQADAEYAGMHRLARIVDNGRCIAGTVYALLPEEAKTCVDRADVVLAKGQGNYESLSGIGRRIFYSFLCKCDLFTDRFHVPRLTGIFLEE